MSPRLVHVSDRADLALLEPATSPARPTLPALAWTVDAEHAHPYWLPPACPRVAVWAEDAAQQRELRRTWSCEARRLHLVEERWRTRLQRTTLHEYEFAEDGFEPAPGVAHHFVSDLAVAPVAARELGTPRALHEAAGIELRFVPDLAAARELAAQGSLPTVVVR